MRAHIAMNMPAAPSQLCPGMRIHAIDIVQPPGIGMPPDIDPHHQSVAPALARKRTPLVAKKSRSVRAPSPRARSVLVFVVAAYPELREVMSLLIAALGNQVEEV